jgi:hypothetical protein
MKLRRSAVLSLFIVAGLLSARVGKISTLIRINGAAVYAVSALASPTIVEQPQPANAGAAQFWLNQLLRLNQSDNPQVRRWVAELTALTAGDGSVAVFKDFPSSMVSPECASARSSLIPVKPPISDFAFAQYQLSLTDQSVREADWQTAILHFQMAFAAQPTLSSPDILIAYHHTLAQLFQEKCKNSRNGAECLLAVKLFWLAKDIDAAAHLVDAEDLLAYTGPQQVAWFHFVQGMAHEETGDTASAVFHYTQAWQADHTFSLNALRLSAIARRVGREDIVKTVQDGLSGLGPKYITWRPGVFLTDSLPDGWRLAGYDLDETLLSAGAMSTVFTLFWLPPDPVTVNTEGWYWNGEAWLQNAVLPNLLPNSSFEWDWARCLDRNTHMWQQTHPADHCCEITEEHASSLNHAVSIQVDDPAYDSVQGRLLSEPASNTLLIGGLSRSSANDPTSSIATLVHLFEGTRKQTLQCTGSRAEISEIWASFRCILVMPFQPTRSDLELHVQRGSVEEVRPKISFDNLFVVPLPLPSRNITP